MQAPDHPVAANAKAKGVEPESPVEENKKDSDGASEKLFVELARLRVKLKNSTDRDIRSVLQMRIQQIEAGMTPEQLKAEAARESLGGIAPAEEEEDEEAPPEPATPAQLVEADRLISMARVEKMRGNAAKSTEFLKQAAEVAPGAPTVLEALGDNYIERKQIKQAIKTYKKAFRLAPKNVGLEEKLALAVLGTASLGSFEDQMRMAAFDSPFLTKNDHVARLPAAIFLSAMIPGVGHLVLGQTAKGIFIVATWIGCIAWLFVKQKDVVELAGMVAGKGTHANMIVLAPIAIMVITYLGSLASLKGMKDSVRFEPVARPKPPVDLPFE